MNELNCKGDNVSTSVDQSSLNNLFDSEVGVFNGINPENLCPV